VKRLFLALGVCLIAINVNARQRVDQALTALPEDLRVGARVVALLQSGEHDVLRDGSNGITCRVPMRPGFYLVRCYPNHDEALYDRLDSYWMRAGLGLREARDRVIEEIRDGAFQPPSSGSTHFLLLGPDYDTANLLSVVMVPMKESGDLGIGTARDDERPYIMWEGTELAHIMIHGRRE